MNNTLPLDLPQNGSFTQDFLSWEEQRIDAMKLNPHHPDVWACWQSARGLCVTRKEHRLPHFKHAEAQLKQSSQELATRRSGGTVVPQGDGILNVTYISLHFGQRNIGKSYMEFCESLQKTLKDLGFETDIGPVEGSYCDGDYNLILDGKKLAGTSQRWVKGPDKSFIILNHAVILITEDGESASRRVNDFHTDTEGLRPYDETTSLSLWESKQNKTGLSKADFFEVINAKLSMNSAP